MFLKCSQGHYNYFRDYDPAIGRYIESDPIGLRGGLSTFGYAASAPHTGSDRLGMRHMNGAERFLCSGNPAACIWVWLCMQKAYSAEGDSVNDIGDARRHCHWSCCMTKGLGAAMAKAAGDAHEFGDENNRECERNMDLFNNAQGMGAAWDGGDCGAACRKRPLQDRPNGSCALCKRYFWGIMGSS